MALRTTRLASAPALRAVIDFFEEIVILPDEEIFRVELQRLFVRLVCFLETPLVFERDRQVVPRGRIRGVELHGFLPPIQRLVPQTVLRDLDPELDLRLGIRSFVRERSRNEEQYRDAARQKQSPHGFVAHYTSNARTTRNAGDRSRKCRNPIASCKDRTDRVRMTFAY